MYEDASAAARRFPQPHDEPSEDERRDRENDERGAPTADPRDGGDVARHGKAEAGATSSSFTANKVGTYSCVVTAANYAGTESAVSAVDFSVNATVGFRKVTFNRKKGTATLRVAVTGGGRLDLYGKGVANAQRKHASGTVKIVVRASGKAIIKLAKTGKAKVKARISYTPEGGKAIKRFKAVVLKKRRG